LQNFNKPTPSTTVQEASIRRRVILSEAAKPRIRRICGSACRNQIGSRRPDQLAVNPRKTPHIPQPAQSKAENATINLPIHQIPIVIIKR
jgi:hypothetical protein